ncbi:DUF3613 domain-containing protein [Pseudomonas sp. S9]|uniref:DUF3613 domain-containing protein n=1 Tax=Pseudomonas sp. S9 TaxID=686578 RepID=UPI0002556D1B|nr:DUF3613 domain-containing protein [Pseudomonas sp. S9]
MNSSSIKPLAICGLLVLGLLVPVPSKAEDAATTRPIPQNSKTESWLAIQREGRAASTKLQTATPAERELAYQRWLDSYSHPIPEFYEQEQGGKMSTGGSN